MSMPRKPSTPAKRRVILLTAGAVALVAILVTLFGAAPRPVDIVVTVADDVLRDRASDLVITSEGATVVEARSGRGALESGRLDYHFWLAPRLHRLELRIRGCAAEQRTFNPREDGLVAFQYRCRQRD